MQKLLIDEADGTIKIDETEINFATNHNIYVTECNIEVLNDLQKKITITFISESLPQ